MFRSSLFYNITTDVNQTRIESKNHPVLSSDSKVSSPSEQGLPFDRTRIVVKQSTHYTGPLLLAGQLFLTYQVHID